MNEDETSPSRKAARLSVHVKPAAAHAVEVTRDLSMVPSQLQLKHILVPVDFSDATDKALRYARKFSEQFGAQVTLLHVIQPMVYPADFGYPPAVVETLEEPVRQQIETRLAALTAQVGDSTKFILRIGQPFHEITTIARSLEVDLIIIPTHGRTGLKHVVLGSTAERVVRHAPCPVLTVREREHDFV